MCTIRAWLRVPWHRECGPVAINSIWAKIIQGAIATSLIQRPVKKHRIYKNQVSQLVRLATTQYKLSPGGSCMRSRMSLQMEAHKANNTLSISISMMILPRVRFLRVRIHHFYARRHVWLITSPIDFRCDYSELERSWKVCYCFSSLPLYFRCIS